MSTLVTTGVKGPSSLSKGEIPSTDTIENWFLHHSEDIARYLIYYTHYCEDVDDLVQETFIRAMKSLQSIKHSSTGASHRVAMNSRFIFAI